MRIEETQVRGKSQAGQDRKQRLAAQETRSLEKEVSGLLHKSELAKPSTQEDRQLFVNGR